MIKSPEQNRRLSRRDFLLSAGSIITTLTLLATKEPSWAQPVTNPDQGTVPAPTETPQPDENEPQEPVMSSYLEVKAFDAEGNPATGVVVAFAHSPDDGSSLFDEEVDLSQFNLGIAPLNNDAGIIQENQFAPASSDGVIAGAQAQEYWEGLIAQAEAEGRDEDAEYLRTHYPPLQPLQKLSIRLDNIYSVQGENPKRVGVRLKRDQNGNYTAILEEELPIYLQQSDDGSLKPRGEEFGLVTPITSTVDFVPFTKSFDVLFDTTGEVPQMKITSDDEQIIVVPVEQARGASEKSVVIDNLDDLAVDIQDTLTEQREAWFLQQLANSQLASTAELPIEPPTSLPQNDRRLSVTVDGSDTIKPTDTYRATFTASNKDEFVVEATQILSSDRFKLSIVNNEIKVEDLSGTGHLPDITINGAKYPNEPHPVDPEPTFGHSLFAPFAPNN